MVYVFSHKKKPGLRVYLDGDTKAQALERVYTIGKLHKPPLSKSGWYEIEEEE